MTPKFISDLREKVGPDHLLWLPGVNAVVVDQRNHVLLQMRSDTREWSLLSGILDPGEQPAAGVVREVREETGVEVVPECLVSVTVSPPVRHPHGDRAQYLELTFRCRPADDAQEAYAADDESLQVAWFAPDGLPHMRSRVRERIELALSGRTTAWFTPPVAEHVVQG
ncbi:NUDIX hydrolase [Nocardiopsis synnemataformans]|uniref:NUDIX hydrolase n=1 Tax=Nocardiopsis synnemataformans TaxID=61305 RepID=UPI003EC0D951